MKNIFKYIALSLTLAVTACAPDYPELKESGLPQASAFDITVNVDQSTNYVTFNMSNKGMVPVWIVGSTDPVDNSLGVKVTGKNYAYTGNNVSLRFRDAGKHTVEVKAYNANGISVGSQIVEFTLNEAYRDPFDASPYIKVLSNGSSQTWEWNYKEYGHFGCGPLGGNGLEWWACGANGKDGWSLYDDKLTFSSDGTYTFDPGDGQVYANVGSGVKAEYNTNNEDYIIPWDVTTSTYSVENEWNEAGVEEIYLVLGKDAPLSYIADKTELDGSRYQILETTTSEMRKCLKLVVTLYTSNNPDGICWHKEFVKEGSNEEQPEEPDGTWYDITGETNLWRKATISPEYWYSPADWSGGIGADASITEYNGFTATIPEGVGGSEWQAQNKLISDIATESGKLYDFSATLTASQDMTVTIKLTGNPEGDGDPHAFFYNGSVELEAGVPYTFQMGNLTQSQPTDNVMLILDFGRSPIGSTITVTDVLFQEHKEKAATPGLDPNSDANLLKGQTITVDYWYSPADWSGGLDASLEDLGNNSFQVTIPQGIGGAEWQGQTKFHFPVSVSASKSYDFAFDIEPDDDCDSNITVKLAWEGNDNDHAFFYVNDFSASADKVTTFLREETLPDTDYDKVVLFVDLGRVSAGTTVKFSNFILQEHN